MDTNKGPLRPGRACVECYQHKTKCNGARPSCARCVRLYKTCVYRYLEPKSFISRLERKVQALECHLKSLDNNDPILSHELVKRLQAENDDHSVLQLPLDDRPERAKLPFYPGAHSTPSLFPSSATPPTAGFVSHTLLQEDYASLIPRNEIESRLLEWDTSYDVTADLRNLLVRIFLPFRAHAHFYMDISNFLSLVHLPLSDPKAIHPCLLNSIYLMACSFGGGAMRKYESIFLSRTRSYLEESLTSADRLNHFMWASLVLTFYYARHGRINEAFNTVSSLVRFAIGCGLHRGPSEKCASPLAQAEMVDSSQYSDSDSRIVMNGVYDQERTNLWYTMFMFDVSLSEGTGLPTSVPDDCITSLNNLFSPPSAGLVQLEQDINSTLILSTKFLCLSREIRDFASLARGTSPSKRDESFWPRFFTLSSYLWDYRSELPSVDDPLGLQPLECTGSVNPHLFPLHIGAYVCEIQLQNVLVWDAEVVPTGYEEDGDKNGDGNDGEAYKRVLVAAYEIARLSRLVLESGSLTVLQARITMMSHIYVGCEVFVRDIQRNARYPPLEQFPRLINAEQGLEVLLDTLLDFTRIFPAWRRCIGKLHDLLLGSQEFDTI